MGPGGRVGREQHKQLSELIAQRGGDTAAVALGSSPRPWRWTPLSLRVGRASGMLFDPVASSCFMVVLSVQDSQDPVSSSASYWEAKGRVTWPAAASPAEMGLMNNVLAEYTERLDLVSCRIRRLAQGGRGRRGSLADDPRQAVAQRIHDHAQFQPGATLGDLKAYVSQNQEAVKIIDAQHDATMERLSTLLDERAKGYQRQLNWLAVVMGLGMLAMVYLLAAFFTSLRRAVVRGISVFKAVATGDLSSRSSWTARDELATASPPCSSQR